MINASVCEWLMDNADAPIRYRVARELLKDRQASEKIESELFENPVVQLWLKNLKPETPPQHRDMLHGSFDYNLENALPKLVRLGLHGRFPQVADAVGFYIDVLKKNGDNRPFRNKYTGFGPILAANLLCMADISDDIVTDCSLRNLDELYNFARQGSYDIYITPEERAELKGVPKIWRDMDCFIKPELVNEQGFCYPLIYDILGLYMLYGIHGPETDGKINTVINYITNDDFHNKIFDGYGILTSGKNKYHTMGWDPKYPGWFDAAKTNFVPKLLFFAEHIVKYPAAFKTKWFFDLICYLNKYKTNYDTYEFPKEWLQEKQGYAVAGFHMSFGENRRKKNWAEIESTFFMQLLQQNA